MLWPHNMKRLLASHKWDIFHCTLLVERFTVISLTSVSCQWCSSRQSCSLPFSLDMMEIHVKSPNTPTVSLWSVANSHLLFLRCIPNHWHWTLRSAYAEDHQRPAVMVCFLFGCSVKQMRTQWRPFKKIISGVKMARQICLATPQTAWVVTIITEFWFLYQYQV